MIYLNYIVFIIKISYMDTIEIGIRHGRRTKGGV